MYASSAHTTPRTEFYNLCGLWGIAARRLMILAVSRISSFGALDMAIESGFGEEFDQIVFEVGSGINAWSLVEFELCLLFKQALQADNEDGASAAFYAMRSFEARLAITNAALESILTLKDMPPELHAEWTNIFNRTSKKAKKRAELAHSGMVMEDGKAKLEVFPKMYHHGTNGKAEIYLTAKVLAERRTSFSQLAMQLSDFEKKLAFVLGIPSKTRLQSAYPAQEPRKPSDPNPTT
jgi:hypothetical protein